MIASGTQKIEWSELPAQVRKEIERYLKSPVLEAQTLTGGFSPGVAAKITTASKKTVFLKSVSPRICEMAANANRREIQNTKVLQHNPRVPKLLHSFETDTWVTLIYEFVTGHHPDLPWRQDQLDFVLKEMAVLSASLTPSPNANAFHKLSEDNKGEFTGWANFAQAGSVNLLQDTWIAENLTRLVHYENQWPQAADGQSLLHTDLRADQILITPDKAIFLDWPHAAIGAPWIDYLFMFPSVELQGGPTIKALIEKSPLASAPRGKVISMAVALAGFFMWNSVQPPPPRLVTIRKFQRDQGDVVLRWLKQEGLGQPLKT